LPANTTVTLDQLVALNDEMAALARAGVPLDQGLLHLGGDLPGRLGAISQHIGQRLQQGEPLTTVLGADSGLPATYTAVIAAGIRSGRLAVALESMSAVIRRAADMRRLVILSLVYPLVVLIVGYVLLAFTVLKCLPIMVEVYRDFSPPTFGLRVLNWLGQTGPGWLPWIPPLFLIAMVLVWLRSARQWSLQPGRSMRRRPPGRGRIPTAGNLMHMGRMASFADTLALLLQHDLPMPEAVCLAAGASGDRGLQIACRRQAERMVRGEMSVAADLPEVSPVLAWLLTEVGDQQRLIAALQRLADSYRRHARWMMRWLSLYLPVLLLAVIGGGVVVFYALVVIAPWAQVLYQLSLP
jgi:general secretion pathway protein F